MQQIYCQLAPTPDTVIELGSAKGGFAAAFFQAGAERCDVLSRSSPSDFDRLLPLSCYRDFDLPRLNSLKSDQVDLIIAYNGLENYRELTGDKAPADYVKWLCSSSGAVLFHEPGPGLEHNPAHKPRWPSYWIALFEKFEFRPVDEFRHRLWNDNRLHWSLRENTLLFVTERALTAPVSHRPAKYSMQDIVHPEHFLELLDEYYTALGVRDEMSRLDVMEFAIRQTNPAGIALCDQWIKGIQEKSIKTVFLACAGGMQGLGPYMIYQLERAEILISGYMDFLRNDLGEEFLGYKNYAPDGLSGCITKETTVLVASPGYAKQIVKKVSSVLETGHAAFIGAEIG